MFFQYAQCVIDFGLGSITTEEFPNASSCQALQLSPQVPKNSVDNWIAEFVAEDIPRRIFAIPPHGQPCS